MAGVEMATPGIASGRGTDGLSRAGVVELTTNGVVSAPFFGARNLLSVSELSKPPKGALKAGSFGEACDSS
ncbi:MAG TPA: hypothetical protein VF508_03085, partial [Pyrinomonadaceae bacterium]